MNHQSIEFRDTPCIRVEHAGSSAVISLHGAQVLSWIAADGRERLFLGERAQFGPGKAIRGGIPVIFPQFAARGPWRRHGFARITPWQFAGIVDETALLRLQADAVDDWPHRAELLLAVGLSASRLTVTLDIINHGASAFTFTAALHSYLRVDDLAHARLLGLESCAYEDSAAGGTTNPPAQAPIDFGDKVDRIHGKVAGALTLIDGARRLAIDQRGFRDVVVWNPGAEVAAWIGDLAPDEYRQFVCVEAAQVIEPQTLAPAARWQGTQILG